jgi:hypothetical protein
MGFAIVCDFAERAFRVYFRCFRIRAANDGYGSAAGAEYAHESRLRAVLEGDEIHGVGVRQRFRVRVIKEDFTRQRSQRFPNGAVG